MALAATTTDAEDLDPAACLQAFVQPNQTDAMQQKLLVLAEGLGHGASDEEITGRVGNGIKTSEAVAAALWAFLRNWQSPEECIIRTMNFGGDTDTIGAMQGAGQRPAWLGLDPSPAVIRVLTADADRSRLPDRYNPRRHIQTTGIGFTGTFGHCG